MGAIITLIIKKNQNWFNFHSIGCQYEPCIKKKFKMKAGQTYFLASNKQTRLGNNSVWDTSKGKEAPGKMPSRKYHECI